MEVARFVPETLMQVMLSSCASLWIQLSSSAPGKVIDSSCWILLEILIFRCWCACDAILLLLLLPYWHYDAVAAAVLLLLCRCCCCAHAVMPMLRCQCGCTNNVAAAEVLSLSQCCRVAAGGAAVLLLLCWRRCAAAAAATMPWIGMPMLLCLCCRAADAVLTI